MKAKKSPDEEGSPPPPPPPPPSPPPPSHERKWCVVIKGRFHPLSLFIAHARHHLEHIRTRRPDKSALFHMLTLFIPQFLEFDYEPVRVIDHPSSTLSQPYFFLAHTVDRPTSPPRTRHLMLSTVFHSLRSSGLNFSRIEDRLSFRLATFKSLR